MKLQSAVAVLVALLGATNAEYFAKTYMFRSMDDCNLDRLKSKSSSNTLRITSSINTILTNQKWDAYSGENGQDCTGDKLGTFPSAHCTSVQEAFPGKKVACLKLVSG